MHAPAIGVLWQLWRRHRGWLVGGAGYFVVASVLCHALPADPAFLPFKFAASFPLVVGLALLTPVFAHATNADVTGRESVFPTQMFVLPMTARALVGWPMLFGTVSVALGWLAVAGLVLRPGGMNAPLGWPALLAAACLAWVQALVWRPFGLPGLRMVTLVVPIGVVVAVSSLRWMARLPEPVVALLLALTIAPAYALAVAGVARARRGDQPDWQWLTGWAKPVAGWPSLRARSFVSPWRAQVWFERRRCGPGMLIGTGLMLLFLCTLIAFSRRPPRLLICLLVVPPFAAASFGGSWGMCERSRKVEAIPAFLATRPITCVGLVWAKMKAAAIHVTLVWAMTLAAFVAMVLTTGAWAELAGHWSGLTQHLSASQQTVIVPLGVVLLIVGTWRPMVANMFFGLAGRNWLNVVAAFVMGLPLVAIIPVACWVVMHPEYHGALLAAVPCVLATAAGLKLLVGAWSLRALARRRLIARRLLARLVAAWVLVAVSLVAILMGLVPRRLAPWDLIASCVVLALPLVRLTWAPLALAWNRHR